MARTQKSFFLDTPYTNSAITGVHPTAIVSPSAELASDVRVGPHAFIGARVKIAKGSYIGANTILEDDVQIGEATVIHPLVFIGHSCQIGNQCEIHPQSVVGKEGFGYAHDEKGNHYRIPHSGRVIIEDRVHLGAASTVDRGTFEDTRIGAGSIFDNKIHLGHNSQIGRNSIFVEGFSMAGSSKIGSNVLAGGHVVVTGHIEVCDGVQLAALSGVGKSIEKPGSYGGYPLQPLQSFLKTKAAIVHLTEMRKQLKKIMKHLGLEETESEG